MSVERKYCFYCEAIVTRKTGVGDHFPIPQRHGGKETVDCCESCHDMKDRIALENWPVNWTASIIRDFPQMSRETRLFMAKSIQLTMDAMNQSKARVK